jgi:hypothetical protein
MHSTQHGSTVQPGLPLPRLETQPAPSEGGQTSSDMQQGETRFPSRGSAVADAVWADAAGAACAWPATLMGLCAWTRRNCTRMVAAGELALRQWKCRTHNSNIAAEPGVTRVHRSGAPSGWMLPEWPSPHCHHAARQPCRCVLQRCYPRLQAATSTPSAPGGGGTQCCWWQS